MPRTKKFSTQIPATPCTDELRRRVDAEAARREMAIADIVREALFSYFAGKVLKSKTNKSCNARQESK